MPRRFFRRWPTNEQSKQDKINPKKTSIKSCPTKKQFSKKSAKTNSQWRKIFNNFRLFQTNISLNNCKSSCSRKYKQINLSTLTKKSKKLRKKLTLRLSNLNRASEIQFSPKFLNLMNNYKVLANLGILNRENSICRPLLLKTNTIPLSK